MEEGRGGRGRGGSLGRLRGDRRDGLRGLLEFGVHHHGSAGRAPARRGRAERGGGAERGRERDGGGGHRGGDVRRKRTGACSSERARMALSATAPVVTTRVDC